MPVIPMLERLGWIDHCGSRLAWTIKTRFGEIAQSLKYFP